MRRHHAVFTLALVVLCSLGSLWVLRASPDATSGSTPSERTSAALAAPLPATVTPLSVRGPAAAGPRTHGQEALRPEQRLDLLSGDPDLADRGEQHRLAPAADARWDQAVAEGGYTASDLDVAVRELFRRIDLGPRYAEGGRIEGLVIEGMPSDHPLAQAGFRPGDLIDRIQGVPLRDPADLPSLLARLGPNFSLCAERQGSELCRELQLE